MSSSSGERISRRLMELYTPPRSSYLLELVLIAVTPRFAYTEAGPFKRCA